MEPSSLSFFARALGKLPGFALRWYFTESRLSQGIYVDVMPRVNPAVINLDPGNTFLQMSMQVINLLPMTIELNRASIDVDCDGAFRIQAVSIERRVLPAGAIAPVQFRATVPDGQAKRLAQYNPVNQSGVSGRFEFECSVRRFSKDVADLRGIHLERLNAHLG